MTFLGTFSPWPPSETFLNAIRRSRAVSPFSALQRNGRAVGLVNPGISHPEKIPGALFSHEEVSGPSRRSPPSGDPTKLVLNLLGFQSFHPLLVPCLVMFFPARFAPVFPLPPRRLRLSTIFPRDKRAWGLTSVNPLLRSGLPKSHLPLSCLLREFACSSFVSRCLSFFTLFPSLEPHSSSALTICVSTIALPRPG